MCEKSSLDVALRVWLSLCVSSFVCSGCHSEFGERYIERVETSKENYDETSCLQTKVYVIRIPCKVYGFKDRSLLSLLNYTLYGIRIKFG